MMEDNKEQQNSSPASGNEENNSTEKNKLRGAASKAGISGQSMIEENSAENTQGIGITGGNVIGGINPETENKAGDNSST
ncbi:hypothetical protein AAE02nite_37980 [Adhaeribacter aerolatus]|uniref:Uncharacterized protein n=1 Tax=Adhaeribacter aerolatus TaxID=670289 RepID=A0A512B2E1_9BACT|nr:hypothetical protein [Adhaeribacter aerolatus]GEO06134.1 hypothetical protein AAE02nite_37980 [Adhaeribacter aerolatus]